MTINNRNIQQEKYAYGAQTKIINNKIKNGGAPKLHNNNAVRAFAYNEYKKCGLSSPVIKQRMDQKDAGHIKAKNKGGKNTNSNYMWEDRYANRAHGDKCIDLAAAKRAGRK
jgi:hypothetical protein